MRDALWGILAISENLQTFQRKESTTSTQCEQLHASHCNSINRLVRHSLTDNLSCGDSEGTTELSEFWHTESVVSES